MKILENTIEDLMKGKSWNWIQELLMIDGVEIFLVGGAVRDLLLGRETKDFDFVVRGMDIERLGRELEKMGKVDFVGRKFGVYKFVPSGTSKQVGNFFDVALPRKEISLVGGGYRDFKIEFDESLDIREDLGRRDFTVNAMAYNLKTGELVDEFGGVGDLSKKVIRTVGNAYERFGEDYSRMLRGIRFSCQLDFVIDKITWRAIEEGMKEINDLRDDGERVVPYEVVANEMLKSFMSNPVKAFDLYDKSGGFQMLVPEVLEMKGVPQMEEWHSEGDVWEHTRLCLRNLRSRAFEDRFSEKIIFDVKLQITNDTVPVDSQELQIPACRTGRNSKFQNSNFEDDLISAELVMAVLMHDVGKPETLETPEANGVEKIQTYNHDVLGAQMAKRLFEKLRLSSASEFEFDAERSAWLVEKHHLFDPVIIESMRNSTIEKYFFGERYSGEDLLKLGFIDQLSSLRRETGKGDTVAFEMMVGRIKELKKMGKGKKLPEPFLNGDEVMKILDLKPGKEVGEVLEELREKQLSGEVKDKDEAIKEIGKLRSE